MKIILGLVLCSMLVGCTTKTTEITHGYVLPDELKDCSVYKLQSESQQSLVVIRCQNSTTSTNWAQKQGKSSISRSVVVIDGIEYEKKE